MNLQSTSVQDRIPSLDFLRGIAVLGILLINIESFAYPNPWSSWKYGYPTPQDHHVRFWVYFLTQGKFYTMFALLFGVGFNLFLDRAQRKVDGLRVLDLYARRIFWLFIFGVIHAYFIWDGDILFHYAICGLLLLPFRSMKGRSIVISIFILAAIPLFKSYENVSSRQQSFESYRVAVEKSEKERSSEEQRKVTNWENRYSEKMFEYTDEEAPKQSYWQGVKHSLKEGQVFDGLFYYDSILFSSLMVMLIGVLLFRSGIFSDYKVWDYYWFIAIGVLLFGLIINAYRFYHWTFLDHEPILEFWQGWIFSFPKEMLGIGYVLILNGIYQKYLKSRKLGWLTGVGRTALSNYIFQSIVLGLLFYGYGLGWHNQFSRIELLVPVVGIWILQILLTQIWLRYYKQGPLEILWRILTYGFLKKEDA
ncbi:DUF418 domain-containing protein [Algoriphagus vanfongensis]|uniref:DUF418 domain-containing protein n=1 Tax=Algoriphagus vanfongensis TaxID=426371 RepID=UPI00047A1713|nr:DUF418 domain-containing protein [Algoriphagus vanfongensis]